MEREERRYRGRTTIKELWIEYFKPLSIKERDKKSKTLEIIPKLKPEYESELGSHKSNRWTPGHIPNDQAGRDNGPMHVYQGQGTLGVSESARRYWLFLREQGWVD